MEFLTKSNAYSEEEEEEEEEEEDDEIRGVACDFFPNSRTQNQEWVQHPPINQPLDHHPLMDLSLRMETNGFGVVEREHMFDKVVTPSDVGKLNRLVIPKQHAEKYFPLDSATNDKGLILNFEDPNGKPWRFRYSYWNSSQSYVMTKGWSRFVKDKKLDAGDVVSFHRGVGDSARDRLFIDWRRRPNTLTPPPPPHHHHFSNPPLLFLPQSLRWATARHLPPPAQPPPHHRLYSNYAFEIPNLGMPHNNNSSMYYFRPTSMSSSPSEIVVHSEGSSMGIKKPTSGAAKRLRLFGVNMECAAEDGGGGGEDLSNGGVSRRGKQPFSLNWDLV